MKKIKATLSLLVISSFALIGFSACEKKSPAEEAAEDVGDAIEDAGDAVKDATN